MEDAKDVVKVAIENIYLVLKYMASGFIAVAVYLYLNNDVELSDLRENTGLIVFLSIAIGLLTYAFHFASLDKKFYRLAACKYWSGLTDDEKGTPLLKEIAGTIVDLDLNFEWSKAKKYYDYPLNKLICLFKGSPDLFLLVTQTYLRQSSTDKKVLKIQELLERRLAFLNFLYCSAYQMIFLVVYFLLKGFYNDADYEKWGNVYAKRGHLFSLNMWIVLGVGIILLRLAYKFNQRICRREQWVIKNYPQNVTAEAAAVANEKRSVTLFFSSRESE